MSKIFSRVSLEEHFRAWGPSSYRLVELEVEASGDDLWDKAEFLL